MRLTLHRSVTFWSGIVALAFVCWAWRDSRTHLSSLIGGHWFTGAKGAGIWIAHTPTSFGPTFFLREPAVPQRRETGAVFAPVFVQAVRLTNAEEFEAELAAAATLKEEVQAKMNSEGQGAWMLAVPFRFLLVAIAVPWFALLLWRVRRERQRWRRDESDALLRG